MILTPLHCYQVKIGVGMGGCLGHCLDEFSEEEEEEKEGEVVGDEGKVGVGDGKDNEAESVFRFEAGSGLGDNPSLLDDPPGSRGSHIPSPHSTTPIMDFPPHLSEYSQKSGLSGSGGMFDAPPGAQESLDVPLFFTSEDTPSGGSHLSPGGITGGSTTSTHPHLSSEEAAAGVPLAPFFALPPKR